MQSDIMAEMERIDLREIRDMLEDGGRVLVVSKSGKFTHVNDAMKAKLAQAINERIESINQQIGDYYE